MKYANHKADFSMMNPARDHIHEEIITLMAGFTFGVMVIVTVRPNT